MKLSVVILLFFYHGALAGVYEQPDESVFSNSAEVSKVEIPVTKQPDAELGLLKQLSLKEHSRRKNRQHIWNRVRRCEGCHAYNMYSGNGYLPILQGQNQEYLYSKLLMFKNNRRSFHPLGRYFEKLSSHDLMDISVFYADQFSDLKRSLVPVDFPAIPQKELEEIVSVRVCSECHGTAGNGDQLIPAISGQNKKYLSYRMREIANNSSRVHLAGDAPVSCKIKDINIRQSRQLASLLSVVVDNQRVEQGAQVYRLKCAQCHNVDNDNNTQQGTVDNWSKHLLKGTRLLVHDTLIANQHKFIRGKYYSFSQNEMEDAIHYMIYQLQHSL